MENNTETSDYIDLFQNYINVCNKALITHKNALPYKQLLDMLNSLSSPLPLHIAIYDDRPRAFLNVEVNNDQLKAAQYEHLPVEQVIRMNMSHLKQVIEHPEEYIQDPSKLHWNWLLKCLHSSQG